MTSSQYRPRLSGLYVILDPTVRPDRPLLDVMTAAAAEGTGIFQYRNKTASMKDAFAEALPLRNRARELGVLFLINDRCDLALALDADGVHLGQNDLPILTARLILGPGKCIGLSTHNDGQVVAAEGVKPDYIGFGPIFKPGSKMDHDPVVGINGLRTIRALTTLPVFAIGGIQTGQVAPVMEAGANGIAVISAVLAAPDIRLAVKELIGEITRLKAPRTASLMKNAD
jgi:thiamine-phosphate pyrophosphorylase